MTCSAGLTGMKCVNRSIPGRPPQGLTTPLDRVQPMSGANRPGL
jgi:hypothetical protein